MARVFVQTVPRCTLNCFASAVTLMPLARAVRVASTSSSVSCVRVRLLGSADAAMSGSSGSPTGSTATASLIPRGDQPLNPLSPVPVGVDGVHQIVVVQIRDLSG